MHSLVWAVFNVLENGYFVLNSLHETEESANKYVKSNNVVGSTFRDSIVIKQKINKLEIYNLV